MANPRTSAPVVKSTPRVQVNSRREGSVNKGTPGGVKFSKKG